MPGTPQRPQLPLRRLLPLPLLQWRRPSPRAGSRSPSGSTRSNCPSAPPRRLATVRGSSASQTRRGSRRRKRCVCVSVVEQRCMRRCTCVCRHMRMRAFVCGRVLRLIVAVSPFFICLLCMRCAVFAPQKKKNAASCIRAGRRHGSRPSAWRSGTGGRRAGSVGAAAARRSYSCARSNATSWPARCLCPPTRPFFDPTLLD